jgi:hypothetical protein
MYIGNELRTFISLENNMKKNELPIFNGPSMNPIEFPSQGPLPTWCDVYIDGQLRFENVFVERIGDMLNIYNSYTVTDGISSALNRVAIVQSDNYIIVARTFKV